MLGICMMAIAALIDAFFVVLMKKTSSNYNSLEGIYYQNLYGSILYGVVLSVVLIFFPGSPIIAISVPQIAITISYNFLVGFIGFIFFFYALRRLNIAATSILNFFEVVSATLLSALFLGEPMTLSIFVGFF